MTDSCLSVVALRHFDRDSPLLGDGWVVGVELDSPVEVLDCPGQVAQLGYGHPPVVMRYRVTWVEDDGDVVVQNCQAVLPTWARASPL